MRSACMDENKTGPRVDQEATGPETAISRRECLFCLARAAAGIAAAGVGAASATAGDQKEELVKVGNLMSLRNGAAADVSKRDLFVTRTDDGVATLSAF